LNHNSIFCKIKLIFRRWIRLLFGREFTIPEVIKIWDLLFLNSKGNVNEELDFSILEYISVSLLLNISELSKKIYLNNIVFDSDENDCLKLLMKYPSETINKNFDLLLHNSVQLQKIYEEEISNLDPLNTNMNESIIPEKLEKIKFKPLSKETIEMFAKKKEENTITIKTENKTDNNKSENNKIENNNNNILSNVNIFKIERKKAAKKKDVIFIYNFYIE
jgi:hypothetical protein